MKTSLRLLDRVNYALAWLGWPGVTGLLLLMAAWLAQSQYVEPMRVNGIAMQQRAQHLSEQKRPLHTIEVARQVELSATLPGAERMPEAVARLFSAANHAGLTLQQGAYRAVGDKPDAEKSGDLSRYQISLPVTGDYPAVRAFVAEALEREPSLALDGLRLVRERMDLAEIDAELRFTLYLGGAQ